MLVCVYVCMCICVCEREIQRYNLVANKDSAIWQYVQLQCLRQAPLQGSQDQWSLHRGNQYFLPNGFISLHLSFLSSSLCFDEHSRKDIVVLTLACNNVPVIEGVYEHSASLLRQFFCV